MAGLISAFGAIKTVTELFIKSDITSMKDVLDFQRQLQNSTSLKLMDTNGSITKLINKYTVTPVIICTESAKEIEIFDKINELCCDLFSSFYLQAFKLLSTQYDLDVTTAIDVLSTDKQPYISAGINTITKLITEESDMSYMKVMSKQKYLTTVTVEDDTEDILLNLKDDNTDKDDTTIASGNKFRFDKYEKEKDPLHSILIRTFNLNTKLKKKDGTEHNIIIPITVKAHIIVTSINSILNLLEPSTKDKGFWARLDEYRAGAISFKELILASDLIKEYKKVKIKDKDKLFNIINTRLESSLIRAAKTGIQGYEANYNMLVISADDKLKIDKYIGGDIRKENTKQRFLSNTNALSVAILDPDYERVSILISDIRSSTDVSFKTIQKRKNDSGQLEDFMKSFVANKPIGF